MTIRCRAGVSVSVLLWIGLAVVLVALLSYWLFASTPDDLLKVKEPTPGQIHKIATQLLVHKNRKIRDDAIQKLIEVGLDAVPVLKEVCLSHPDPDARWAVLRTLMVLDVRTTADVLEKLIVDPEVSVRLAAVSTAVHLKHSASHAILIKAIDDEDAQVRFAAMEGCEWKKIVKAVPKLKAALGHGEIAVQEKAARALKVITKRSYEGRIKRPNKE